MRHIAYCCAPKRDGKTSHLRQRAEAAGGVWREVTHLTEAELAHQVRADGVDILVELTGGRRLLGKGCMYGGALIGTL